MAKNQEIYEYLIGSDDDGSSININVESKQTSLGANFEDVIYPAELIVEIESGNNIQMMISYDNAPYRDIGRTVKKGINRIALDIDPETGDFPRCQQLRIAYREFSQSPVIIGRLAMLYYDSEEIQTDEGNAVEVIATPVARGAN